MPEQNNQNPAQGTTVSTDPAVDPGSSSTLNHGLQPVSNTELFREQHENAVIFGSFILDYLSVLRSSQQASAGMTSGQQVSEQHRQHFQLLELELHGVKKKKLSRESLQQLARIQTIAAGSDIERDLVEELTTSLSGMGMPTANMQASIQAIFNDMSRHLHGERAFVFTEQYEADSRSTLDEAFSKHLFEVLSEESARLRSDGVLSEREAHVCTAYIATYIVELREAYAFGAAQLEAVEHEQQQLTERLASINVLLQPEQEALLTELSEAEQERLMQEKRTLEERLAFLSNPERFPEHADAEDLIALYQRHPERRQAFQQELGEHLSERQQEVRQLLESTELLHHLVTLLHQQPPLSEALLIAAIHDLHAPKEVMSVLAARYEALTGETFDEALARQSLSETGTQTMRLLREGGYQELSPAALVRMLGSIEDQEHRQRQMIHLLQEHGELFRSPELRDHILDVCGNELAGYLDASLVQDVDRMLAHEIRFHLQGEPPRIHYVSELLSACSPEEAARAATRYEQLFSSSIHDSAETPQERLYLEALCSGSQLQRDTEGLLLVMGLRGGELSVDAMHAYLQSLPEDRRQAAVEAAEEFARVHAEALRSDRTFTDEERQLLAAASPLESLLYLQAHRNATIITQVQEVLAGREPAPEVDQEQRIRLLTPALRQALESYQGRDLLDVLYQFDLQSDDWTALQQSYQEAYGVSLSAALSARSGESMQEALAYLQAGNRVAYAIDSLRSLQEEPAGEQRQRRAWQLLTALEQEALHELRQELNALDGSSVDSLLTSLGGADLAAYAAAVDAGRSIEAQAIAFHDMLHGVGMSSLPERTEAIISMLRSMSADERVQVQQQYQQRYEQSLQEASQNLDASRQSLLQALLQNDQSTVGRQELLTAAGLYGGDYSTEQLNALLAQYSLPERLQLFRELEAPAAVLLQELPLGALTEERRSQLEAASSPVAKLLIARGRSVQQFEEIEAFFGVRGGHGPLGFTEMAAYRQQRIEAQLIAEQVHSLLSQEQPDAAEVLQYLQMQASTTERLDSVQAVYEELYGVRLQAAFEARIEDQQSRAVLSALLRSGKIEALATLIEGFSQQGQDFDRGNQVRLWIAPLSSEQIRELRTTLASREPAVELSAALGSIGGSDLPLWVQAREQENLALSRAVLMHQTLSADPPNHTAALQLLDSLRSEEAAQVLRSYQEQYDVSSTAFRALFPAHYAETLQAFQNQQAATLELEAVMVGLGLRGNRPTPLEIARMNEVLQGLSSERRAELRTAAASYAHTHWETLTQGHRLYAEQSRPATAAESLRDIVRAQATAVRSASELEPIIVNGQRRPALFVAHADRVLSLFDTPRDPQLFRGYLQTYNQLELRQRQYRVMKLQIDAAIFRNRARLDREAGYQRQSVEAMDEWALQASIPGFADITGSDQLYDVAKDLLELHRDTSNDYAAILQNLTVVRRLITGSTRDASQAEYQALDSLWAENITEANSHLQAANTEFQHFIDLAQSEEAQRSPNFQRIASSLSAVRENIIAVNQHCQQMQVYLGRAKMVVAVVGGAAVVVASGGAAGVVIVVVIQQRACHAKAGIAAA